MKKSITLFSIAVASLLLTGCGSDSQKTMTCTMTTEDTTNNYTLNATYKVYYTGDLVDKVVSEEIVTSEDETIRAYFEQTLKTTYEAVSGTYGGYTYTVTNNDNKVTSNVTIDYSKMDLDKYVTDNAGMEAYVKDGKLMLSGLQTTYETAGATCK